MGYSKEGGFKNLLFGEVKQTPDVRTRTPLDRKRFEKIIYNYKSKSQEIIYKALEIEVEYIKKINPGYKLKEFSKPVFNNDGSATYFITFEK